MNANPGSYVSCWYIESALVLHPNTLYHCCIPVNGVFGSPPIAEYLGGPLPFDAIERSREEHRKKAADIQNYPGHHCHGCVFLQEKQWDNKHIFNNIHFNNSFQCNLSCKYCVQRAYPLEQHMPKYDILPVVEELISSPHILAPDAFIFWGGGEPVILKDFDKSLELLCEHGTVHEIATNSTIFSQALYDYLKKGVKIRLKTSIDCGTREKFAAFRGRDLFDQVWTNLEKYASTGGDVSAKYIVSGDNREGRELDGFIERVRRHHIRHACVDLDHNMPPADVTEEFIGAAAYLCNALLEEDVQVLLSLHSRASCHDFTDRVLEVLKMRYPSLAYSRDRHLLIPD